MSIRAKGLKFLETLLVRWGCAHGKQKVLDNLATVSFSDD
jgi:hypothetical protein